MFEPEKYLVLVIISLKVNGDCAEAGQFIDEVFDANLTNMKLNHDYVSLLSGTNVNLNPQILRNLVITLFVA